MRAIHLNDYGSADNFELVDVPAPTAEAGQVRIKIDYAGLRWGDIMQRNGRPSRHRQTPFIAGQEVAGTVDQIGDGVVGLGVGQKVFAMVPEGGFAEYVLADPATTKPVPDTVPLDRALAYPVNMRTAYLMVYVWAKVQENETVLLHSAAGGVGMLVLQILKRRFKNVRVIGICSSEEKAELLRANGCDHVVNRKTQNYVEEVNRICGPKATGFAVGGQQGGGVDVSFNGVAGATIDADMQLIRKRGRWVLFGYQGGDQMPIINTAPITYDGITILPVSQLAWWGTPEMEAADAFIADWLANERLIDVEVWPLERVADAERAMEAGQTTNKVVFDVAGSRQ